VDCPDWRVAAFVSGELPTDEERAFDQHLLECEGCWRAVQEDRFGRAGAAALRTTAPAGLSDRVRLAISIAEDPSPRERSHRGRHWWTAFAGACAVILAVVLPLSLGSGPAADPPQIAAVMAMVQPGTPSSSLQTGEHLTIAGQPMRVRAFVIDGGLVVAATSSTPFAMPASSHLLSGSTSSAWMASSGSISLYGVNRLGSGRPSMFLVASMPIAKLPGIAVQLNLI
jgi:anti-sigma factor RsiW